jgi:hypothetical protein
VIELFLRNMQHTDITKEVSSSTDLVLNELNRSPTWAQWLRQCVGFGNKIVDRKDDGFVGENGLENVLLVTGDNSKHCWYHGLLSCIQR